MTSALQKRGSGLSSPSSQGQSCLSLSLRAPCLSQVHSPQVPLRWGSWEGHLLNAPRETSNGVGKTEQGGEEAQPVGMTLGTVLQWAAPPDPAANSTVYQVTPQGHSNSVKGAWIPCVPTISHWSRATNGALNPPKLGDNKTMQQ